MPHAKNLVVNKVKQNLKTVSFSQQFNPVQAGMALVSGLIYLKSRWDWSGSKIAKILHLPANTVNTWLKQGHIPLYSASLQPEIQAVVHLLAIHASLEAMFEKPEHQQAWLQTPHPDLQVSPEEKMRESFAGLIFIRQYLDYVRGHGA